MPGEPLIRAELLIDLEAAVLIRAAVDYAIPEITDPAWRARARRIVEVLDQTMASLIAAEHTVLDQRKRGEALTRLEVARSELAALGLVLVLPADERR